jgi:hypothetical protein
MECSVDSEETDAETMLFSISDPQFEGLTDKTNCAWK